MCDNNEKQKFSRPNMLSYVKNTNSSASKDNTRNIIGVQKGSTRHNVRVFL